MLLISIRSKRFDNSFVNCVEEAAGSAAALVNLLVDHFPCFRDEVNFEGKDVHFYKRAQILVADLWACFEGDGYGRFHDIDKITMFAGEYVCHSPNIRLTKVDYRIPQMLYYLGCLTYCPPLQHHIRQLNLIESGHTWEVQIRGKNPF